VGLLGHIPQDVLNIFLAESADLLGQWDEACYILEKGGDSREALLWLMRTAQSLRRASRGVGLEDFAQALASTEELIRELLKSDLQPHRTILDVLALAHTTLGRWLVGVRTDPDYVEDISALSDAVRICRSSLQRAAEDAKYVPAGSSDSSTLVRLNSESGENQQSLRGTAGTVAPLRIEELIDAVGRLATQHGVLSQFSRQNDRGSAQFLMALENSFKLSTELQTCAVRLRMIPLAKLFEKLSDFVLDLSEDRRVALQFDCEGQDVELDAALVEGLWRPLSNLVQIAFDLNFDTPDERVRGGKLPSLILKLSAKSENGTVQILIEDDGKGVSENDNSITGGELKTELEKVRALLSAVSGTLKVAAQKDRSTCFQIVLPESLRLMDIVVVQCQNQSFAIPSHVIDQIIEPGLFHTHILRGDKQFIEYSSKIYPFVTLPELLEKSPPQKIPRVQASVAIERGHVILLRCGRDPIALGIETILEKQRSVVNPLSPHLQNVRGLSGTVMTGRGEPVIMLDIVEITGAFWAPKHDREAA
jgi:chemotaxis protein histidine kinase CheA